MNSSAQFNNNRHIEFRMWGKLLAVTKRKFRIVKRENNIPVLGMCEYCSAQFTADPETIGRATDAHAHLQKQFIAHKCKRLDSSQNAVRTVKRSD